MKVGMKVKNTLTNFVGIITQIKDGYATIRGDHGRFEYATLTVLTEV